MTDIFKDKGLDEDPGWAEKAGDPLVALRFLFMSFFVGVVVVCGIAWKLHLDDTDPPEAAGTSIAIIAAFGVASLAAQHFIKRDLDCASFKSLALSYRSRFLLRLAFSESVMLAAFAVGRAVGPWWVVFIGVGLTLVGFYRAAPTQRHLQQDQDRLSLSGCQLRLTEALRTPVPSVS